MTWEQRPWWSRLLHLIGLAILTAVCVVGLYYALAIIVLVVSVLSPF